MTTMPNSSTEISGAHGFFRRLCLFLCCLLLPVPAVSGSGEDPDARIRQAGIQVKLVRLYAEQLRDANLKEDYAAGGFTWDTEGKPTAWRYYNGFMIDAFLRLGGGENTRYAECFYRDQILPDGSIPDYLSGYLDSVEPARGLFRLISGAGAPDERYLNAVQWVYSRLETQRTYPECGNNYLHHQEENGRPAKSSRKYPVFLDGMYMTQPFLAECAALIRKGELSLKDKNGREVTAGQLEEEILYRYAWLHEYLYDEEKGLYQHGWDVLTAKGNGHYWGRGIGWLAMSMTDVIELLPEGPGRERIQEWLRQLLDGMLRWQDPGTGMWYNVVDRGPELEGNRTETSVTSMMAYALIRAWNRGYASGDHYLQKGLEAFSGVIGSKMFFRDGRIHVGDTYLKSGVGETDEYYCAEGYTTDEAKGVAALLMASVEIETAIQKLTGES